MPQQPGQPDHAVLLRVLETEQLLIAADQLGRLLDISPRSVWRLLKQGQLIEPLRLGGSVRWRLADVKAWINAGCPPIQGTQKQ